VELSGVEVPHDLTQLHEAVRRRIVRLTRGDRVPDGLGQARRYSELLGAEVADSQVADGPARGRQSPDLVGNTKDIGAFQPLGHPRDPALRVSARIPGQADQVQHRGGGFDHTQDYATLARGVPMGRLGSPWANGALGFTWVRA
jgi:hypothetical protein